MSPQRKMVAKKEEMSVRVRRVCRKINQRDNRYRLDAAEGFKHIETGGDVIEGS